MIKFWISISAEDIKSKTEKKKFINERPSLNKLLNKHRVTEENEVR